MKNKDDIKRLTGGKEIMEVLVNDLLQSNDVDQRIKITNSVINFIQAGINERKQTLEERKHEFAEAKYHRQLMDKRAILEDFEKGNASAAFLPPPKEEKRLSLYDIKQQVNQWHKMNGIGGLKDYLPNGHQFEEAGPQYVPVVEAIYDHGGFEEVAHKLGLRFEK